MRNNTLLPTKEEEEESMKIVEDIMKESQSSYVKKEMPQHLLDKVKEFERKKLGFKIEEIDPFN